MRAGREEKSRGDLGTRSISHVSLITCTHESSSEKRENLHPIMMHPPQLLYVFLVLFRIPFTELDGVSRFVIGIPRTEAEEFEFVRCEAQHPDLREEHKLESVFTSAESVETIGGRATCDGKKVERDVLVRQRGHAEERVGSHDECNRVGRMSLV